MVEFVFTAPTQASVSVAEEDARFPVRRFFCAIVRGDRVTGGIAGLGEIDITIGEPIVAAAAA